MAMLEVVAHLRANADNMVSGFRRAQGAADDFGHSVQTQSSIVRSGFGIMSKAALIGGGAMQTAAMMGAKMGIGFAMANEQAIISFKTLLGSQQKAEAMFKDLQDFAASTPFEFPQLRDAASKLLTTGVAAERVKPILTALGDSTAAMGTGAQGIQAAVRALQQMNLVGKVTGQDMMQLANAGIPAWDALASAAGMSVAEVKKAVEKGQLDDSVGKLMQGIESYSGEAMGRVKGMMAEQSKTLVGLMSTLKDNINIALGEMMMPATEAIKDAMPAINDAIGKTMKSMVGPINKMVTVFMDGFQQLIPSIEPMMTAVSTIMVAIVQSVIPIVTQLAQALPALQPMFIAIGESITSMSIVLSPLISDILVGLIPAVTVAAGLLQVFTGFFIEHRGVLEALTPVLGAAVGSYIALKAIGKINALFGSAKAIWGVVTAILANTTATGSQAVASSTAAVASSALMVAQAQLAVAAGAGAAGEAALAAAETAQGAAAASAAVATRGLNAALISNPIGIVIALIAGLVIGFIMLWKKFEGFRNFWKKTWNLIVDGVEFALNAVIDYWSFFINTAIAGINLLIKAWNLISWGDDVKELQNINFELDLSAIKIKAAADNAYTLADGLLVAKAAAEGTYESSQSMAKEMAALKGTLKLGGGTKTVTGGGGKTKPTGGGGTSKEMDKLISAAKKLGTDAVENATKFFDTYKKKSEDFSSSIKDAVVGVWNFSNALSASVASKNNYESALDKVASAEEAVNSALASRDMAAYAKAIADYTKATADLDTASKGKMSFMDALKKQYDDAMEFDDVLNKLRQTNLSESNIAQIVAAGAEAGTAIGNEILAGGEAAVDDANRWYTALTAAADSTAKLATDKFYATGLTQGEALVKGITDAAAKLDLKLTSKGMTKNQLKKLESGFGISIGFSMTSLANLAGVPEMANGGVVRARSGGTLALLGEAGSDEAVIPLNKSGLGGGGNTYNITVQTGVGDKHEIGRELISILQAHEKRSGRLPIRTM